MRKSKPLRILFFQPTSHITRTGRFSSLEIIILTFCHAITEHRIPEKQTDITPIKKATLLRAALLVCHTDDCKIIPSE